MENKGMGLAELKNLAMGFDRAEMRELYTKEPEEYLCKTHMLVWNIDKQRQACIAPKNYTVIQHKHAVESIIEGITSLNIKANANVKTDKHKVLVDFDFPDSKFELKQVGDQYTTGIRVESDYSRTAGLVISPRVTRLVCTNGMVITSIVKSQRIKFTEELTITVEGLIDKMIKDIISSDEKLANMVSICMKDSVEWTTVKLLVKQMFNVKKHAKEILKRIDANKERVTRWDLYNAITEYCSKGERLKPHVDAYLQAKAEEIMQKSFDQLSEVEEQKEKPITITSS